MGKETFLGRKTISTLGRFSSSLAGRVIYKDTHATKMEVWIISAEKAHHPKSEMS